MSFLDGSHRFDLGGRLFFGMFFSETHQCAPLIPIHNNKFTMPPGGPFFATAVTDVIVHDKPSPIDIVAFHRLSNATQISGILRVDSVYVEAITQRFTEKKDRQNEELAKIMNSGQFPQDILDEWSQVFVNTFFKTDPFAKSFVQFGCAEKCIKQYETVRADKNKTFLDSQNLRYLVKNFSFKMDHQTGACKWENEYFFVDHMFSALKKVGGSKQIAAICNEGCDECFLPVLYDLIHLFCQYPFLEKQWKKTINDIGDKHSLRNPIWMIMHVFIPCECVASVVEYFFVKSRAIISQKE